MAISEGPFQRILSIPSQVGLVLDDAVGYLRQYGTFNVTWAHSENISLHGTTGGYSDVISEDNVGVSPTPPPGIYCNKHHEIYTAREWRPLVSNTTKKPTIVGSLTPQPYSVYQTPVEDDGSGGIKLKYTLNIGATGAKYVIIKILGEEVVPRAALLTGNGSTLDLTLELNNLPVGTVIGTQMTITPYTFSKSLISSYPDTYVNNSSYIYHSSTFLIEGCTTWDAITGCQGCSDNSISHPDTYSSTAKSAMISNLTAVYNTAPNPLVVPVPDDLVYGPATSLDVPLTTSTTTEAPAGQVNATRSYSKDTTVTNSTVAELGFLEFDVEVLNNQKFSNNLAEFEITKAAIQYDDRKGVLPVGVFAVKRASGSTLFSFQLYEIIRGTPDFGTGTNLTNTSGSGLGSYALNPDFRSLFKQKSPNGLAFQAKSTNVVITELRLSVGSTFNVTVRYLLDDDVDTILEVPVWNPIPLSDFAASVDIGAVPKYTSIVGGISGAFHSPDKLVSAVAQNNVKLIHYLDAVP